MAGQEGVRYSADGGGLSWEGGDRGELAISRRFQRDNLSYLGSPQAFLGTQCLRRPRGQGCARHAGYRGAASPSAPTCSNTCCRARPLQLARTLAMRTGMRGGDAYGRAREVAVAAAGGGWWRLRAAPRAVQGGAAQVSDSAAVQGPLQAPHARSSPAFLHPRGNFGVHPASRDAEPRGSRGACGAAPWGTRNGDAHCGRGTPGMEPRLGDLRSPASQCREMRAR